MEPTLFSVELPWCCFCVEIKVLGMTWKFTGSFCGIYKKYWRKNQPKKWSMEPTSPPGAGPPGRAWQACWAHNAPPPPISALYIPFRPEKKSERRIHRVLRYGSAATSCSTSGGQIWSPFWAPERGNRRHRHHQPSSIANSMMLFTVRE